MLSQLLRDVVSQAQRTRRPRSVGNKVPSSVSGDRGSSPDGIRFVVHHRGHVSLLIILHVIDSTSVMNIIRYMEFLIRNIRMCEVEMDG